MDKAKLPSDRKGSIYVTTGDRDRARSSCRAGMPEVVAPAVCLSSLHARTWVPLTVAEKRRSSAYSSPLTDKLEFPVALL